MATTENTSRLRRAVALGLVVAGTLWIVAAGLVDSLAVPATRWRVDRPLTLTGGGALLALGAVAPWLPLRLSMALAAGAWTALAAAGAGYRGPRAGDVVVGPREVLSLWTAPSGGAAAKKFESQDEWLDNFTTASDRYGQVGQPGVAARHVKHAFDVIYHLDADGFRVMPAPQRPDYRLAFVGCSYAFGHGVEDGESFPALLAAKAWPTCLVLNRSLPGWGTVQARLQVEDLLAAPDPPQCIVYAWITHHLQRNYLRQSWHGRMFRKFPLYEIADDGLAFQGLQERERATWPDGPELDAAERDVTLRLIDAMRGQCEAAGVTFVFLVVQHTHEDDVFPKLAADPRYRVMDVSDVSHEFLPEDRHPTRRWHQAVASAIAADPRLAEWTGRPELHRPQAVAAPPTGWTLSINYSQGARADLYDRSLTDAEGEAELRVDHIKLGEAADPWSVQLNRDALAIEAGQEYTVRFRVRAAGPRAVRFGVAQAHPPWNQLGLWKTVTVGTRWQWEQATFTAAASDTQARLSFVLGDDVSAVEINDLTLDGRGGNLLTPPAAR